MIKTREIKAELEIALGKARSLRPVRETREKFNSELRLLPSNATRLLMKGKNLSVEKARIEGEIQNISHQEQDLRQEVRDLFSNLVKASIDPVREKIVTAMPKRQRLHALLVEAAAAYRDLESVQQDWKAEVDALKKAGKELKNEMADEWYTNAAIPEPPFASPWTPAPSIQTLNRTALMLEEMAKQIG
jgi:chromosome segregation ATPase